MRWGVLGCRAVGVKDFGLRASKLWDRFGVSAGLDHWADIFRASDFCIELARTTSPKAATSFTVGL